MRQAHNEGTQIQKQGAREVRVLGRELGGGAQRIEGQVAVHMLFREQALPYASEERIPRYLKQSLSLRGRQPNPKSDEICAVVQPELLPFLHLFLQVLLEVKTKRALEVPL